MTAVYDISAKTVYMPSGERLEALLQHAAAHELPYAEFLEQVLGEEVAAKTSKNIAMRTSMARFPFVKPLETFEFDYQPSIDRKQVHALASCHYIEHGDNVIVLGPPGVGKTHLAVSLGLKAIFLALAIAGFVALRTLPINQFPSVNVPVVSVTTVYPGANPKEMETQITRPIEDAVAGLTKPSVRKVLPVTTTFSSEPPACGAASRAGAEAGLTGWGAD